VTTKSTWAYADAFIAAAWGGRNDSPAQLAIPLSATFHALAKAGSIFAGPWEIIADDDVPFPATIHEWQSIIESRVVRNDDGEPEPSSGYSVSFMARRPGTPHVAFVRLSAGQAAGSADRSVNRITIGVDSPGTLDIVDLRDLLPGLPLLLDSLVVIWRPDWVSIVPLEANEPQIKRPWRGWPVIGALTWLSGAVSDVPAVVAGAEVRPSRAGRLIGVPSLKYPAHDPAAIFAVRQALVAASAIRQLPARQARAPITDPQEFEAALLASVDLRSGRAVVERPERVRELFPGQVGDRLLAEIREAGARAYSVWTSGANPNARDSRAEARAKIAILVPGLTSAALDHMVEWWVDLSSW
jgi:hypothetical protein